jgi:hypothetical protein
VDHMTSGNTPGHGERRGRQRRIRACPMLPQPPDKRFSRYREIIPEFPAFCRSLGAPLPTHLRLRPPPSSSPPIEAPFSLSKYRCGESGPPEPRDAAARSWSECALPVPPQKTKNGAHSAPPPVRTNEKLTRSQRESRSPVTCSAPCHRARRYDALVLLSSLLLAVFSSLVLLSL